MNRFHFASGLLLHSAASRIACVAVVVAVLWAAIHWAVVLP